MSEEASGGHMYQDEDDRQKRISNEHDNTFDEMLNHHRDDGTFLRRSTNEGDGLRLTSLDNSKGPIVHRSVDMSNGSGSQVGISNTSKVSLEQ